MASLLVQLTQAMTKNGNGTLGEVAAGTKTPQEQAAVLAALRVLEARGSNKSAARALRCFKVMEKTDEGAAFVKWIFALSRDQELVEAFGVMKATALFSFLDMEMWKITPHSELQRGKYKTSHSVGQAPDPSAKGQTRPGVSKQLSFYGDLWLEVCASSVLFITEVETWLCVADAVYHRKNAPRTVLVRCAGALNQKDWGSSDKLLLLPLLLLLFLLLLSLLLLLSKSL